MNIPLPTGTVTFLFTDIQGSTPLWEREPEKMAQALQIHNAALRQAFEANGGVVFKTVGDAFQAAFPTAPQALKAAIEGQRALQSAPWNELGPLKVRMGLHTGEAQLDPGGDEYAVSHTKNRIGRIHSVAFGGQILLSQETADLVRRILPEGVSLKDLGEHRLKGMEWHEHLYQVYAPDLLQDFPPLATAITHPNNLPVQLSSFIGREKEIAAVIELLAKHRLVTLTGSGGVGKTRLALSVAESSLENFPDGIWLVALDSITDSSLIPQVVASIFNLRKEGTRSVSDILVDILKEKQILLVLDNCEHLIQACAQFTDLLLRSCPMVKVLATSREALVTGGETPYRVPSLEIPDHTHLPGLVRFQEYESVHLFTERAQVVLPGFKVTEKNIPTVSQIVHRLDGIPLAIELAAARLDILTLDQLAQRLDNAFRLLVGGSRSALPRQQTLRAAIDWSYALLSEPERILLRRLSIFAGGCTLEAAESVCAGNVLEPFEIMDGLSSLAKKSILIADRKQDQEVRYRLLEIVRQYAQEKLHDSGETAMLRERHLGYFMRLAQEAEPHLRGNNQQYWKERLSRELDNLRLAMESSLTGSIENGLSLAAALMLFWHGTYYRAEGVAWLDRLLAAESAGRIDPNLTVDQISARQIARGKALIANCWNRWKLGLTITKYIEESADIFQSFGDQYTNELTYSLYLTGQLDFQQSLELFRLTGEQFYITEVLFHLAAALLRSGDLPQAKIYFEERQALCRKREDLEGQGCGLWELGLLEFLQGNIRQAIEFFEMSRVFLEASNQEFSAFTLRFQAWVALSQGNIQEAIHFSQLELSIAREHAFYWVIVDALGFLGWEARLQGENDQAASFCEEAMKLDSQVSPGALYIVNYVLGRLAIARGEYVKGAVYVKALLQYWDASLSPHNANIESPPVQLGIQVAGILTAAQAKDSKAQARRAAILFGAQSSMSDCLMNILPPVERIEYEQSKANVRSTLGKKAFSIAWEEGQMMSLEQAVAYALEETD